MRNFVKDVPACEARRYDYICCLNYPFTIPVANRGAALAHHTIRLK